MRQKVSISLEKTAYLPSQLPPLWGPVVLFLGRSNVGKSSLLNAITQQGLAKVSKNPGKTRSVNYYRYGKKLQLIDLPGYGYARRSHQEIKSWSELMRAFFDTLPKYSLAFILMDCQRNLEADEFALISNLEKALADPVVLFTKADRLKQSDRIKRTRAIKQQLQEKKIENVLTWSFVSVKNREGISDVRKELYNYEKDYFLETS